MTTEPRFLVHHSALGYLTPMQEFSQDRKHARLFDAHDGAVLALRSAAALRSKDESEFEISITAAKLTRQGVTDLGGNHQLGTRRRCRHFYTATEPIGRDLVYDADGCVYSYETRYGKRCVHCGDVKVIL